MTRALGWLWPLLLLALWGAARRVAHFLTDWMWFDALEHGPVFLTTLGAQLGLGAGAAVFVGLLVWFNGRHALQNTRNRPVVLTPEWRGTAAEHWLRTPEALRTLVARVSLLAGALAAVLASASWADALAWWHHRPFEWEDPILALDASFYVFALPLLEAATWIALLTVVLSGGISVVLYTAHGALRLVIPEVDGELGTPALRVDPGPRRHLASLTAALAIVLAVQVHLSRYAVVYASGALIDGPGYTDTHLVLPLLTLRAVSILVAGYFLFQALDSLRGAWLAWAVLLVGLTAIVGAAVPAAVQQLYVLPNELDREGPFIAQHIRASRYAWGLEAIEERALTGDAELSYADIEANRTTFENVRLWDHGPLLETFRQVQEIRTYYDFSGVDNDRYVIDGQLRQTMLSPRELLADTLPSQAQTWVNKALVYTHGYGVALGPVNRVTDVGLPHLFVQDIPPTVTHPVPLAITRPEIYFGERMDAPVFVRTGQQEFDFPTADGNATTTYEGLGGVPIAGFVRRLLMAMRLGDVNVLLSSDLNDGSRLLLYRQVVDRLARVAPFLWVDDDPYMVIADGRLVWVLDAYTSTNRFPYSARRVVTDSRGRHSVNYVRNSVKAVIDAYDGTLTLYLTDDGDPLAAAWARAYPGLFADLSEMPATIREHLRYPRAFFAVQAELFASFHMTASQTFYNREDEWQVPGWQMEVNGNSKNVRMEPYYTVMKLPGEEREEFILMLPYVPTGKDNLAAWLVARSDGDSYGGLRVYRFPKDRLVFGPGQIVSRILQNDLISEKLTLWNQQTSEAELGTLLVIPVEESLIYVQPLYLRASSDAIPELKRVIVAYEHHIAMRPTLEEGLRALFGVEGLAAEPAPSDAPDTPVTASADPGGLTWQVVSEAAARHYERALEASREGDWADFGSALDALGASLEQLRALGGQAPAPAEVPPAEAPLIEAELIPEIAPPPERDPAP